jgi:hypothetical protein
MRSSTVIYLFLFASVYAVPAVAQGPPADPPPPWTGSLSAGIAVTGGNTDTTSTNFAFDVQSDKTKRNVFKADGLNIRSSRDGDAIVDRMSLNARDEYGIGPRAFVFGQVQYLRDAFKNIDIFNPVTQGRKFDPLGDYVRRWVPELARVPAAFLHAPWEAKPDVLADAGVLLGRDYPAPIVDHADARARFLSVARRHLRQSRRR